MKEQAKISRNEKTKRMIGEQVRVLFEGESNESDLLVAGTEWKLRRRTSTAVC